jgi:hypothetical protein
MSSTIAVCGRRARPVDPGTRQIGQSGEAGPCCQPGGFEAAHLACRRSLPIEAAAIHHGAHRRIVGQPIGVVDILVAGELAKH